MDPAKLNLEEDMMDSDQSFDEDFNMMDEIKWQRMERERKKREEMEAIPQSSPSAIPEKDRKKL